MNQFYGEIAAIVVAIFWSFTSIFFTIAVKYVGSIVVNQLRLILSCILLMITHLFIFGNLAPIGAEPFRWWWLGLSGCIGLVIGDGMLLQAFAIIGTRISMLLLSLVPIISTLLAWIFLHEFLNIFEIGAIFITIGGISWVVSEKNNSREKLSQKKYLVGILLGIGGAVGQAVGLVIAKKGIVGDFPALSANLIRIISATLLLWIFAIIRGTAIPNLKYLKIKSAVYPIIGGSVFGPFLGVWLSLIAIKYANIGIASTLMALPPIFLLPLTYWIFKEKINLRAFVGTMIAVAGVAVIFLV